MRLFRTFGICIVVALTIAPVKSDPQPAQAGSTRVAAEPHYLNAVGGGHDPVFGDVAAARSPECDLALVRIYAAAQAHDLPALEIVADAASAQFAPQTGDEFVWLMEAACRELAARNFGASQEAYRKELLRRYARAALDARPTMPLTAAAYFTTRLMSDPEADLPSAANYASRRKALAELAVQIWARLAARVHGAPDQTPTSSADISAPTEDSTIDPSVVADPALRANLVVKLQQERADAAALDAYRTRVHYGYFGNAAETYLTDAYSRPPYAIDELRGLLAGAFIDQSIRWRILGKVIYNREVALARP